MNQSTAANANCVPIARVDAAINVWRNLQAAAPGASEILVPDSESRCLANLYGLMIYNGWASVPLATLSQI